MKHILALALFLLPVFCSAQTSADTLIVNLSIRKTTYAMAVPRDLSLISRLAKSEDTSTAATTLQTIPFTYLQVKTELNQLANCPSFICGEAYRDIRIAINKITTGAFKQYMADVLAQHDAAKDQILQDGVNKLREARRALR